MRILFFALVLLVSNSILAQFEPNGISSLDVTQVKNVIPKKLPLLKIQNEDNGLLTFNGVNTVEIPELNLIGSETWVLKPIKLIGKRKQVNAFTVPQHMFDKDFYTDRTYRDDAPLLLHEFLELKFLNRKKLVKEVFAISTQKDSQVASHLLFALYVHPSYASDVEYVNIVYWLLDLNEAKETTQSYINDLAKVEDGNMGLTTFNNKYKSKNTMLNKEGYAGFLNRYLTSYEIKKDFFPTHNDDFKKNLSNSGLSMDSVKIELTAYEKSLDQLRTFNESINEFYDRYYNKYISSKSYPEYVSFANVEAVKIMKARDKDWKNKNLLILSHEKHDSGIRNSYKTIVKNYDISSMDGVEGIITDNGFQEKELNVLITLEYKPQLNWEDAEYDIFKVRPNWETYLTFVDTLYELTDPTFYNTQLHGDSAISIEKFKNAVVDSYGNKLIECYVGRYKSNELPKSGLINGVTKSTGFSRKEDGSIALRSSFRSNKDSVNLGLGFFTFDINQAYSTYLENYNRTKERFANERAAEAAEEESLEAERLAQKQKLYATYGKKYVDSAYDFEFIVGMHEDLANIIVQELWDVHSSDQLGTEHNRYWLEPNSSVGTIRVMITIKNKKITQVSSW
tara:strand:+ start:1439 stop:3307 length:1869 start_codon:yes stop_codon:yes gene_type:complete